MEQAARQVGATERERLGGEWSMAERSASDPQASLTRAVVLFFCRSAEGFLFHLKKQKGNSREEARSKPNGKKHKVESAATTL